MIPLLVVKLDSKSANENELFLIFKVSRLESELKSGIEPLIKLLDNTKVSRLGKFSNSPRSVPTILFVGKLILVTFPFSIVIPCHAPTG